MRLRRRIETIAVRAAPDQLFAGKLTIVDVRSEREDARCRVPGLIHIPMGDLRRRLGEVRSNRPVAPGARA